MEHDGGTLIIVGETASAGRATVVRARALVEEDDGSLTALAEGAGAAIRHPNDENAPGVGIALATARALIGLGKELRRVGYAASRYVCAVEPEPEQSPGNTEATTFTNASEFDAGRWSAALRSAYPCVPAVLTGTHEMGWHHPKDPRNPVPDLNDWAEHPHVHDPAVGPIFAQYPPHWHVHAQGRAEFRAHRDAHGRKTAIDPGREEQHLASAVTGLWAPEGEL